MLCFIGPCTLSNVLSLWVDLQVGDIMRCDGFCNFCWLRLGSLMGKEDLYIWRIRCIRYCLPSAGFSMVIVVGAAVLWCIWCICYILASAGFSMVIVVGAAVFWCPDSVIGTPSDWCSIGVDGVLNNPGNPQFFGEGGGCGWSLDDGRGYAFWMSRGGPSIGLRYPDCGSAGLWRLIAGTWSQFGYVGGRLQCPGSISTTRPWSGRTVSIAGLWSGSIGSAAYSWCVGFSCVLLSMLFIFRQFSFTASFVSLIWHSATSSLRVSSLISGTKITSSTVLVWGLRSVGQVTLCCYHRCWNAEIRCTLQ